MKRIILAALVSTALFIGGGSLPASASGTSIAYWGTVTMCSWGGFGASCQGDFGGGITYKFVVFFTKFQGYNIPARVQWNGYTIQEASADPGNSITTTGVSCYPGKNEYTENVAACTGTFSACIQLDCTPFGNPENHWAENYFSTADDHPREKTDTPNCGNANPTSPNMCVKTWSWGYFTS